ncbi:hypothetical protein ACM66B_001701 [Microbotryomycetes sp. NB124-2]
MQAAAPLVDSTWQQVSKLADDYDRDEWEEDEVCYLTLDFGKLPTGAVTSGDLQLLALNSDTPFARVGGSIFRGQHESLIGSEIFLERDNETGSYSPWSSTTNARIQFDPVKLVSKSDVTLGTDTDGNAAAGGSGTQAKSRGTGRSRGRPRKIPPGETRAEADRRRKAEKAQRVQREMDQHVGRSETPARQPEQGTAPATPQSAKRIDEPSQDDEEDSEKWQHSVRASL